MNGEIEAGSPSSESYSPVLYNSPIETALLVRQLEGKFFFNEIEIFSSNSQRLYLRWRRYPTSADAYRTYQEYEP